MIQFILHIISVVITAFLVGFILVWIQRKFAKQPKYHITYEYRVITLRQHNHEERLGTLGKEGWEACLMLGNDYNGVHILFKRETLHTS